MKNRASIVQTNKFIILPADVKAYYNNSMPFITSQPHCYQDIAPSVLEENSVAVSLANEWENEWNQSGLASRLSKEVLQAAPAVDCG